MCYSSLVACLIGVYFITSSGALLTVEHALMPELKLNETVKEKTNKEKDVIDQYTATDTEPNMESNLQIKHKSFSHEQEEHSKTMPSTFSVESIFNLSRLDINSTERSPQNAKNIQTNTPKNYNKGYEGGVIDAGELKTQKEQELEVEESEKNDLQNQRPFFSGLLEQYGSSPLKPKIENITPGTEDNPGYENILKEIFDDEDLQYIFNITHNLDAMRHSFNNESLELHTEEPSSKGVIDIKDLETAYHSKEENVNDDDAETSRNDRKIKKQNFIKEENGVKTRILFDDLQKDLHTGKQQEQQSNSTVNSRLSDDVPDINYFSEITIIGQNDDNPDKAITAFHRYFKNNSELHVSHHENDTDVQQKGASLTISNMNVSADPCINVHCKRGKMCKTDRHGNPTCVCQDPDYCLPGNKNDLVCGTDNKTYTSVCHLFATKCHFEGSKEGNHLHLDYQGPCKYIPPCTEYELMHFPFRMRDWLKNVLMQLYERDQKNMGLFSDKQRSKVKKIYEDEKRLQEGDHNIDLLVKDFQKNYHMYVYPVHWQFHQLDQHLMDRLLSHSELAALRAPLIPIEHCVNAFLQECNTNSDRHISLWEWCRCFGIKEGDINEDLLF